MEAPPRASRIIRNKFVAGLIILIPIVITVKALWWLFNYLDGLARPISARLFGTVVPGAGLLTTIAVVLLTGILFSSGPLRRLLEGLEDVLESVPLVGTVYITIKKVLQGFGRPKSHQAFQRFVFARLPGRTTPGFLTGAFTLRHRDGTMQVLCTIYIPTNHLYVGDVVVLPAEDVIETDLSVEDGISIILSAGTAVPPTIDERARPEGPA
jgi:uncharacterized membrane protein